MNSAILLLAKLWQTPPTTTWGHLLIATGGTLKPVKIFCYLMDYKWEEDGTWNPLMMVNIPPIKVPLPNGMQAPIM